MGREIFLWNCVWTKFIKKLINDQINILSDVPISKGIKVTHVKPHGALNNIACEDFDLAKVISEAIIQANKELIFLVPPGSRVSTTEFFFFLR